jgi:hypothetical protein
MVIVFSALTITTSGIRAQELRAEEGADRKKPKLLKFVFWHSAWQKLAQGRRRWTIG